MTCLTIRTWQPHCLVLQQQLQSLVTHSDYLARYIRQDVNSDNMFHTPTIIQKTEFTSSKWHQIALAHHQLKSSVKEPNMFHNYETEKITHKASDMAANLQLYRVVRFFRLRSLCTTTHLILFSERPQIYASCMTISGSPSQALQVIFLCGKTEQHVIIGFGELAAVD